jgi:hypothetical protein
MVASLKDIKRSIERLLPPDIVAAMREADAVLTLSPASGLEPIVDISDELADRELLGDMVSYRKKKTGVDNTIFLSQKGYARHGARIKIAIDPPHSIDVTSTTASVSINSGEVTQGEVSPVLLKQVQKFIELNRPVLLDYWDARIDTDQLAEQLKAIDSDDLKRAF